MHLPRPPLDAPAEEWLVYADSLQIRDDPLGALIVLNHAGNTAARDAHIARHADAIFGAVAPHYEKLGISWRYCLAETVDVDLSPEDDPRQLLSALLASPIAPSIRRLRLVARTPSTDEPVDLAPGLALLGERLPSSCVALDLVDARARDARILVASYYTPRGNLVRFGSLDAIWKIRHLESLSLQVADMAQIDLGTIDAPSLLSFSFLGLRWDEDLAGPLAAARWPRLRHLALRLAETVTVTWPSQDGAYVRLERYDEQVGIDEYGLDEGWYREDVNWSVVLGPLLASLHRVPLVSLSLTSCASVGPLLEALERHGLPETLRSLDLSESDLEEEHAQWMRERWALLSNLERLDLRGTLLEDPSALAVLAPEVLHSRGPGALHRFSVGVE